MGASRTAAAALTGAALLGLGVREALRLRDADLPTARERARRLGPIRVTAGMALIVCPQLLTDALGLEDTGATARSLPRLLAVREIALGAGTLAAGRPTSDPWPWLMTLSAVDGAEAVVLAAALRHGRLDPTGGWAFVAADLGSATALPLRVLHLRGGLRPRR